LSDWLSYNSTFALNKSRYKKKKMPKTIGKKKQVH
jgi:hypothetical protein